MLDDKYRIDLLLAVGGMGAVYVGEHTKLQKTVAVKVLRTELAEAEDLVERFQREAIAASQIGHDNIVEVTDIGATESGVAFLVMEYLEGESLGARLKKVGALPVDEACDIAIEVLAAIEAAHAVGIIHRDLKPENVFLAQKSRGETVKILDFGISRIRSMEEADARLTRTGTVMGTPYYMSPEQARGSSEIGPASDVYSAGVILYEMLTGKLPCEADNYNMVMFRVVSGDWLKPRQRVASIPVEVEEVICRAMALEPEDRYASAADLAVALAPYAGPPTPLPRITGTPARQGIVRGPAVTAETGAQAVGSAETVAHPTAERLAQQSSAGTGLTVAPRSFPLYGIAALVVGVAVAVFAWKFAGGDDGDIGQPSPAVAESDTTSVDQLKPAPSPSLAQVEIQFDVSPANASITLDGVALDGAVARGVQSDALVAVRIEAEGFEPYSATVRFDVAQRITVALKPEIPDATAAVSAKKKKKKKRKDADEQAKSTDSGVASDDEPKKTTRIISDSPYD